MYLTSQENHLKVTVARSMPSVFQLLLGQSGDWSTKEFHERISFEQFFWIVNHLERKFWQFSLLFSVSKYQSLIQIKFFAQILHSGIYVQCTFTDALNLVLHRTHLAKGEGE